jgi:hypothetical protein
MNTGFLAADIRSSSVQTYYPLQRMLCNAHFPGTRTLSKSRVDIVVYPYLSRPGLVKASGATRGTELTISIDSSLTPSHFAHLSPTMVPDELVVHLEANDRTGMEYEIDASPP